MWWPECSFCKSERRWISLWSRNDLWIFQMCGYTLTYVRTPSFWEPRGKIFTGSYLNPWHRQRLVKLSWLPLGLNTKLADVSLPESNIEKERVLQSTCERQAPPPPKKNTKQSTSFWSLFMFFFYVAFYLNMQSAQMIRRLRNLKERKISGRLVKSNEHLLMKIVLLGHRHLIWISFKQSNKMMDKKNAFKLVIYCPFPTWILISVSEHLW